MTPIELYSAMIGDVIPYVTIFCLCNMVVNSILNAAFRGRLEV